MFYPLRVLYIVKYERLALKSYLFRRSPNYVEVTFRMVECCASQKWEYICFNVQGCWMREPKDSTKDRKRSSARVLTILALTYSILYSISDILCIFEIQSATQWNLIDRSITALPRFLLPSTIFPPRSFHCHFIPASKIGANVEGKKKLRFQFFLIFFKNV